MKIEGKEKIISYLDNQLDVELSIPGIRKSLYPFQKKGVKFLLENGGRGIIADSMGLGKTLQALSYSAYTNKKKVLVVCPASVKYSWKKEISESLHRKNSLVIDANTDINEVFDSKYQYLIINYDILKRFINVLSSMRIECMIVDEAHYVKTQGAIRSKAVKILSRNIPSLILLSGTPFLSRPSELYNLLNILDPRTWNNWISFTARYCNGHRDRFGWNCDGASNIQELKERIKHLLIRRVKEEVLLDLPEKNHINIPVELDRESFSKYKMIEKAFVEYLRDVKKKSHLEIQKSLMAEQLVKLNELRMILSKGKIKSAIELIENIIDSGEKVVVFSTYVDTLKKIQEHFNTDKSKPAVMICGEVKDEDRANAIKSFQEDDKVKIFLGGIKSAGVGITLTSGSNVLFVDYSWVPADHWQAEDRCHRIGQKASSVNIYQIYCNDTIDELMFNLLKSKEKVFKELFSNNAVTTEEGSGVVKDIINALKDDPKR